MQVVYLEHDATGRRVGPILAERKDINAAWLKASIRANLGVDVDATLGLALVAVSQAGTAGLETDAAVHRVLMSLGPTEVLRVSVRGEDAFAAAVAVATAGSTCPAPGAAVTPPPIPPRRNSRGLVPPQPPSRYMVGSATAAPTDPVGAGGGRGFLAGVRPPPRDTQGMSRKEKNEYYARVVAEAVERRKMTGDLLCRASAKHKTAYERLQFLLYHPSKLHSPDYDAAMSFTSATPLIPTQVAFDEILAKLGRAGRGNVSDPFLVKTVRNRPPKCVQLLRLTARQYRLDQWQSLDPADPNYELKSSFLRAPFLRTLEACSSSAQFICWLADRFSRLVEMRRPGETFCIPDAMIEAMCEHVTKEHFLVFHCDDCHSIQGWRRCRKCYKEAKLRKQQADRARKKGIGATREESNSATRGAAARSARRRANEPSNRLSGQFDLGDLATSAATLAARARLSAEEAAVAVAGTAGYHDSSGSGVYGSSKGSKVRPRSLGRLLVDGMPGVRGGKLRHVDDDRAVAGGSMREVQAPGSGYGYAGGDAVVREPFHVRRTARPVYNGSSGVSPNTSAGAVSPMRGGRISPSVLALPMQLGPRDLSNVVGFGATNFDPATTAMLGSFAPAASPMLAEPYPSGAVVSAADSGTIGGGRDPILSTGSLNLDALMEAGDDVDFSLDDNAIERLLSSTAPSGPTLPVALSPRSAALSRAMGVADTRPSSFRSDVDMTEASATANRGTEADGHTPIMGSRAPVPATRRTSADARSPSHELMADFDLLTILGTEMEAGPGSSVNVGASGVFPSPNSPSPTFNGSTMAPMQLGAPPR